MKPAEGPAGAAGLFQTICQLLQLRLPAVRPVYGSAVFASPMMRSTAVRSRVDGVVDGLRRGGAGAKEKDADQNSQRSDAPPLRRRKGILDSNLQIQSLLASAGVHVHRKFDASKNGAISSHASKINARS